MLWNKQEERMPSLTMKKPPVADVDAASPSRALEHCRRRFEFETDCRDVRAD